MLLKLQQVGAHQDKFRGSKEYPPLVKVWCVLDTEISGLTALAAPGHPWHLGMSRDLGAQLPFLEISSNH